MVEGKIIPYRDLRVMGIKNLPVTELSHSLCHASINFRLRKLTASCASRIKGMSPKVSQKIVCCEIETSKIVRLGLSLSSAVCLALSI